MSVLLFGVSHRSAPVVVLEQLSIDESDQVKIIDRVLASPLVTEAMVLSTCNRVEVYAVVDAFHGGLSVIGQVLAEHSGMSMGELTKYAGRAGDGFICTSGKGEELYTEKLMPAVREGAAAADRSVDGIDKMIEIKISYDPDPELALNNTRFWAPLSLTAEQKHSIDDPIEMEKAADALPIEQIAKRWIVASDPDEAVEKVGQYVTWGLNHLVFHAPGHDQRRFLELFQSDLAPRLRRLG